jgi:hypothetical protein
MASRTRIPKSNEATEMSPAKTEGSANRNLFRAIATDIHFWIPFTVLIAGFVLLDKLS